MASSSPFEASTLPGLIDVVAARYPDREALVFGAERVRFADLRDRSLRLARGLAALGLGRGDALAIWMPTRPSWYLAQHACARLGAVAVALNARYRAHELRYILAQCDARALLLTDHLGATDYLATLHEVLPALGRAVPGEVACEGFPALRHVIVDAEDPYPGCHRLVDVLAAGDEHDAALPVPAPDDVLTILYTSGTTSFPKGAMISHRNCVPHGWHCGEVLRLTPADRVLHTLPAPGTWGGLAIPLSTWSHGACLVLEESFDPLRTVWLIERERCTIWNVLDQMAQAVLDLPDLDRHDRRSLRSGGFAATAGGAHGLFQAVVERIGLRLAYQPYGMTEVNALALMHDLDETVQEREQPGVTPPPGLEVRVVHSERGAPCRPGEEGEMQFRGPRVTRGYYHKPEETARAFTDDGWFRTGDLGVQDDRGRTIFRGRLREALRISHQMVAPGEIEAFLMAHPAVAQAFVVGVPDARTGEAAFAWIILREGATLTEAALQAWCRGKIATFKIPRTARFVQDVPRAPGPHGDKVQRGKLREMALGQGGDP